MRRHSRLAVSVTALAVTVALAACASEPRTLGRVEQSSGGGMTRHISTEDQARIDLVRAQADGDRFGDYCEPNAEDCDQPLEALTAFDKATFLSRYDRIFTPEVIAAIRTNKVREGFPEDDNIAPSVLTGEYFLELEDVTQQRVFTLEDGVYKLSRVPFYS